MVIQAQIVGRRLSIIYSMVMAFLTEALPAKEKTTDTNPVTNRSGRCHNLLFWVILHFKHSTLKITSEINISRPLQYIYKPRPLFDAMPGWPSKPG